MRELVFNKEKESGHKAVFIEIDNIDSEDKLYYILQQCYNIPYFIDYSDKCNIGDIIYAEYYESGTIRDSGRVKSEYFRKNFNNYEEPIIMKASSMIANIELDSILEHLERIADKSDKTKMRIIWGYFMAFLLFCILVFYFKNK